MQNFINVLKFFIFVHLSKTVFQVWSNFKSTCGRVDALENWVFSIGIQFWTTNIFLVKKSYVVDLFYPTIIVKSLFNHLLYKASVQKQSWSILKKLLLTFVVYNSEFCFYNLNFILEKKMLDTYIISLLG